MHAQVPVIKLLQSFPFSSSFTFKACSFALITLFLLSFSLPCIQSFFNFKQVDLVSDLLLTFDFYLFLELISFGDEQVGKIIERR
ncbi:unnamed protein product, partial [Vitis vinifera]